MKKLIFIALFFSANVMSSPVNINTADAKTISKSLKGIGMKKAQTIVEFRKKQGAFKTLEDFGKVPGVGPKTISANKADILLSDSNN